MNINWIRIAGLSLMLGLLAFMARPAGLAAQEPLPVLGLSDILKIAVQTHPLLKADEAQIQAQQGAERQARSNYLPQVNWQSGYTNSGGAANSSGSGIGSGVNQTISTGGSSSYTSAVSLQQLVSDFGKTSASVRSAQANVRQAREQLQDTLQQVLYGASTAYFNVLQARAQLKVQQDTVENFKRHLAQSEDFFKVGTRPKIDVTQAKVNLSNSLVALEQASNNLAQAKTHLNTAMGMSETFVYELKGDMEYQEFDLTLDQALKQAFANRHDYKAMQAQLQGAEQAWLLKTKGLNPTLSTSGTYSLRNNIFPPQYNLWNYGLSLSVPLFDGFSTQAQILQARAAIDKLKAQVDNLKLNIEENVKSSYLNLSSARKSYQVTLESVALAQENLDLADQRYQVGVGSFLEFSDAQLGYLQAETNRIQNLSSYATAIVALKQAMGALEVTP